MNDESEELMNLLQMNVSDPEYLSIAKIVMVDDQIQCSEEFSNEDKFISWIVTENNDPANVPDDEQEECVDSCNVKPTMTAATSSIEIFCSYFEREHGTRDYLQN